MAPANNMNRLKPYLTILCAAVLLAACGGEEGQKGPAAGAPPPPAEVDVITVASDSVIFTQDLPGRLEAYRTAQVRARVEGVVEKRLFVEGSDVRAGTRLFQIDARSYSSAHESARADMEVAQRNLERYKPLLAAKVVSQQAYDLVDAKLRQTQAALTKAQIDLENAHAPAPISGHIGRAQVTEGALVGRGEATLMATIEQIDPIYANFTQSGADVLRLQQAIKSGKLKRAGSDKVELMLEDGSVYALPGKLLFSDLAVDPATGSVSIRAVFPNPKRELLPGMFARIRFPESSADNSIRLPQRAVQAGPQGQFVMVVDGDSKAVPRPVQTGGMAGADFVISSGLKVGEQVIVNGLQKARPGTVVKPVQLNAQAGAQPPEKK
jgi:membrane fusion protein (multidrug efflux system)